MIFVMLQQLLQFVHSEPLSLPEPLRAISGCSARGRAICLQLSILALVSQQRDKKKGKVFGSAGDDEFSGIKILEIKLYDSSFKFQY